MITQTLQSLALNVNQKCLKIKLHLRSNMIAMEIPDPFQTFVSKKYNNAKGYIHDWFSGEWSFICTTCKEELFGPSRKIMTKIRLYHTRNECLGGY
jgi:hypothetical protein